MNCVGGLSNGLHRRLIHNLFIGVCLLSISEGCPQNKTNTFVWKKNFIHGISMCERVGEDSRHGMGM